MCIYRTAADATLKYRWDEERFVHSIRGLRLYAVWTIGCCYCTVTIAIATALDLNSRESGCWLISEFDAAGILPFPFCVLPKDDESLLHTRFELLFVNFKIFGPYTQ